ncbi:methyl-accepting chemotaxis protein [Erwinia mallotivora]|uniref:Tsr n=1 Tax=Erwinia mallotivora TaxID=69222 RepID=A0A014M340_9GAMM|nr:methyl-accepting chemotaxis protein [Erwinia mallotivora]EXU76236.1 Tsr [Erwinia mallotivora]
MSLLTTLPLRWRFRPRRFTLHCPAWLQSLRGAFVLLLVLFCLLQCSSALLLTRLVGSTQHNVQLSHQLNQRQALLDEARMELLTASDNSNRAVIWLMQDNQTGSVDSWKSLAETARASLDKARTLFTAWQADSGSPLKQNFDLLADGLDEQLKGLNARDIDAVFMVPMQAYQQQFNDAYYQSINSANARAAQLNQSSLSALTDNRNLSLAIFALLLLLLLTSGMLLLRGVILPLDRLSRQLSRYALGELSQPVLTSGPQAREIRQLIQATEEMRQGLQHIVREINAVSQAVMDSARQIAQQNSEFSHHNQQQSSVFEHLSGRLNRVAEEVENSVGFASHANQQVQEADTLTRRCGDVVAEVDARMRQIVDAASEISGIVSLLDGMSLQTRLLSLNASIESAHAGIYGRSFSIVAKEIGMLAEQSGTSTRNIDRLISRTHQHIDKGFSSVVALESLYGDITVAVTSVVTLLQELLQNADAQSRRVNTIATEIDDLNQQVKISEALTGENAQASATLVEHAQRLSHSVSQFVL